MKCKIQRTLIFFCLAALLLTFPSCSNHEGQLNAPHGAKSPDIGIQVLGGQEGEDWDIKQTSDSSEEMTFLNIWKDGLILSGTADTNLIIVCRSQASKLVIKDLNQGEHKIEISFGLDAGGPFILLPEGENQLCNVSSFESLTLQSGKSNASLSLTGGVRAGEDLQIKDLTLQAGVLRSSFGSMNIEGNSVIELSKTKDEAEYLLHGRMEVREKLHINLGKGGSITIKDTNNIEPIFAQKEAVLSKNNQIVAPKGGIMKGADTPYGPNCYFVFHQDGSPVRSKVIIRYEPM